MRAQEITETTDYFRRREQERKKEQGVAEGQPNYDDNQYSLTDSTGKELTLLRGNTPEEAIERAKQLIGSNEKLLATFGLVKLTPRPHYIVRNAKRQSVAEGSLEEYGDTKQGQKMLDKVHHRAANRVTSKQADKDPAYARRAQQTQDRAWDRMKDKDVAEGKVSGYKMYKNPDGTWYVENENEEVVLRNASQGEAEHMVWSGNEKLKKGVSEGSGNWYVRVRGKVLKDKQFNAIPFPSEEAARTKAMEIHNKKRTPLAMIKITQSWMDGPETQGVAEGEKALQFATQAHLGQTRSGGEPYITHPMRVAEIVKQYKQSHNIEALINAALLHDTIEDTDTTHEALKDLFGGLTASLVKELTSDLEKIKEVGKSKYLANKMAHELTSWALVIKLADRLDNVQDIATAKTPEWRARYKKETEDMLSYLKSNRELSGTHQRLINAIRKKLDEVSDQQGVAEDDAGDLEKRMIAKIEKEKQRLAKLKQTDPEAYKREMSKHKTSSRIPPVSTF